MVRDAAGRALGEVYGGSKGQQGVKWGGWKEVLHSVGKGLASRREEVRRASVGALGAMGSIPGGSFEVVQEGKRYLMHHTGKQLEDAKRGDVCCKERHRRHEVQPCVQAFKAFKASHAKHKVAWLA